MWFNQPLMTLFNITTLHTIIIINEGLGLGNHVDICTPMLTIKGNHLVTVNFSGVITCKNVQYQILTKSSLIE